MKLHEVILTGKPHRRKNDNYVYFVPHVGGIGYSQQDVMAEDWMVADGSRAPVKKPEPAQVLNFMDKLKNKLKL